MKKSKLFLLLTVLFMFSGNYLKAQAAVVYDPTNNAQLIKSTILQSESVANTASMVKSLETTIEYLKKTEEALKKVNAGLESIIWTKRVYQRQVDIIKMQYELSVKANKLNSLKPEELYRFSNQLLTVVNGAESLLSSANDILTEGVFKMSDSERLTQLKDLDKTLSFQQTIMKMQYFELKTISEEREIIKTYRMIN